MFTSVETMTELDLSSPLISPQTILTIHDSDQDSDPDSDPTNQQKSPLQTPIQTRIHNPNPYEFIGSTGLLSVPSSTTIDPFRNGTPSVSGGYEVVKIVVCLPIALARLVLFGACLVIGYIATKMALAGWKDKQKPMPKWRSRIMWITRICSRFILFSFGYHWIRRKGKPAPREIAPVVVSNHVSYIEPIFYFYELFPTIVASESHDSIPLVGTIIRAMQIRASCDTYPRLLLFPEGTTTNGKALISFQLGAFIAGHPIQPVIVRYPHVHFDQSWGLISLAKLMFRMFTQFHNFMEVEYLPVIMPPDNQNQSAVQFAEKTGQAMATALNVVQTSHSYGDLMLLMKAAELQQERPWSYMVEMARIESLYHISSLEAVEFLDKFLSMNPDTSGCVKLHDFLRVLRLKPCKLAEEIFGFLDVEKNGSITFKQFLFGVAHVMKQPRFMQACELAFAECNVRRDDYCMKQELADILRQAIPDLNEDKVHGLFNLFDTDNDGRISRDDFFSCLKKNPLLIALFSPRLLQKDFSKVGGRMLEEIV